MHTYYLIGGAAIAAFVVGVVFSPGISRIFAVLFTDVKKEYAKALEEVKAIYDADTQALRAEVARIQKLYDTDVAKLKSDWSAEVLKLKADLGEANNKVAVFTAALKSSTVLAPQPVPATAAAIVAAANTPADPAPAVKQPHEAATTRTKAEIAADLAATQTAEAQLQAELAAATE